MGEHYGKRGSPIIHKSEAEFAKRFFRHDDWVHEPAKFRLLGGFRYTPDFYDPRRNVFIEVAGTRSAYYANLFKYDLFRRTYPGLRFEIRLPNGDLLNRESPKWPPTKKQIEEKLLAAAKKAIEEAVA